MSHQPLVLQGQIETTEIRISGKLPGRVDSFLVREGDWVQAGDTLVVINSPTIEAKYRQVNALEQVAQEQNKKIDAGTRRQIIATAGQLWNKTKRILSTTCASFMTTRFIIGVPGATSSPRLGNMVAICPSSGAVRRESTRRAETSSTVLRAASTMLRADARSSLCAPKMDGTFRAEVPAIGKKDVEFRIYYISPLGSFATWKSTKQTGAMTCRRLRYTPVLPKK